MLTTRLPLAAALMLAPAALALDTETDFETINTTTGEAFMVGTAEFSGDGFSGVAGIPELYFTGTHAWMVNPGGTGVIDFGDTNAALVQFQARIRSTATGDSVFTSFDDGGVVIETFTISDPAADFQLLTFAGNIDRIEIVNSASVGTDQMNGIDDFGFNAVPEPGSLAALGLGALLVLRRRR